MIIWFSGSGNSLAVARKLAEATQDSLLHLNDAPAADLSGEKVIGLVYPTYSYDAPLKIKEMLGSIRFPKDAYLWIVVTCGSTPGNSIFTVRRILRQQCVDVSYSRIVSMPDSSAICFGNDAHAQDKKLDAVPAQLEEIAGEINDRILRLEHAGRTFSGTTVNSKLFFPIATAAVKQDVNRDKCIGCGICAKVCPNSNITVVDKKAQIGLHCTQCLACVHFCPQQAMEIRHKPTIKEIQYHHPEVNVKELIR